MQEQLDFLNKAAKAGETSCWCRVIATRGSTPQKAGATMVVLANGTQAGTLGGGCIEADVKRAAVAAIGEMRYEHRDFVLDDDYGWDDGLICGGRMTIALAPATAQLASGYFETLQQLLTSGKGFTEVVALGDLGRIDARQKQADPQQQHAAFLFDARQQLVAHWPQTPDSASAAAHAACELVDVTQRPKPYQRNGCAYLPIAPRCCLIIVGGGHVGKAVADLAVDLDFDTWIVDDRAEYVSEQRFPRVDRRISGNLGDVLPSLEITSQTYCLIVTRGHNHDEEALFHLVDRGAAYVGMIGSKRKIRLIFDDLLNDGVSEEALRRVHAPVGLAIGSQAVPEIAVSIAAEFVAHRNLGGRVVVLREEESTERA